MRQSPLLSLFLRGKGGKRGSQTPGGVGDEKREASRSIFLIPISCVGRRGNRRVLKIAAGRRKRKEKKKK